MTLSALQPRRDHGPGNPWIFAGPDPAPAGEAQPQTELGSAQASFKKTPVCMTRTLLSIANYMENFIFKYNQSQIGPACFRKQRMGFIKIILDSYRCRQGAATVWVRT
jgi:hypothetical protein